MTFDVPDHIRPMRDKVYQFMVERVEPSEPILDAGGSEARSLIANLQKEAKSEGLWALGHPAELGGGGLPFLDYVYINEVQGRSEYGQLALGTWTLQDSIMLNRHASPRWREAYLEPLVQGEISPSFGMTEPDVAGSDPTQLQTTATLDGDEWVINGRKWFTTGAADAAYTTVMCRTETDAAPHASFSMIIVPTDHPGYRIVRDTPVLGLSSGHYEVEYDNVRVPAENLLGERGNGFVIAQERLGPGRIFHSMRWLGQAQRAFDLMCHRLNERVAFGEPLANKQLMQQHVFDSYTEIQASRLLTLKAAEQVDRGDQARVEIGAVKVFGARMLHNVVDRAVQVFGAAGVTEDTPLSHMYRAARFARIYDGADEVHIQSVGRRILSEYRRGGNWEFGLR
ncbi:acyl-CoA dehydrogenase family protein [Rhodococcus sp. TAF43]|uniref:acyl-CoA dehydrogenase family protein n=1 Tax=unclassified Rhodococcus (in: high G+C Gram-positive bacteria) TaxID=192944 RepID=UPI000E0C60F8|nr:MULTISPECIES: acyl-CoA dehydrogenase family protein [unclassified Rhodococcus (in: high G+C Gram-positive bacteria)]QKT09431.1 acyl-CoA dehydrogenase family protein [Rhodococcus sp. W8901]RDI16413.1 alkylation response protein AidB-like acyl-CoA dehydrogenase [Rhodococcus sp. AG1013]